MTILQSLKKLHKKMTGQETTSKTIGGILDSMQENYSDKGGGSALPTPGTVGNVLTSTGDSWESAAPPNTAPLIVTITGEEVDGVMIYTANKLIKSEIIPAVLAGRTVYVDVDAGEFTLRYSLSSYDNADNECMVGFSATIPDTGSSSTLTFAVHGAGYLIDSVEHDDWTPILPG